MKTKITLHTNRPISGATDNWRNVRRKDAEELVALLWMLGWSEERDEGSYPKVIHISEELLGEEGPDHQVLLLTFNENEGWEVQINRLERAMRREVLPFEIEIVPRWEKDLPVAKRTPAWLPSQ